METWWQAAALDLSGKPSVPGPTMATFHQGTPDDDGAPRHFRLPLWGGQLRSMSAPSRDEGSGQA